MDNIFNNLLSLQEAADLFKKDSSTLRRAISSGRLVEGIDCKKFGKQWVISLDSMIKLYGEPK